MVDRISKDDVDKTIKLLYNRHTKASYRSSLRFFIGVELNRQAIQSIVSKWQNVSSSTIVNRKAALERLVSLLASAGRCDPHILDSVTFPKGRPPKMRRALTQREVGQFVKAARSTRDRLLTAILFDSGLRAGTIPTIRYANLFAESFVIQTKRGRHLEVYPSKGMAHYAIAMMEELGADPGDYIFTASSDRPISYKTLHRAFRRMASDAGIDSEVTTHSARHTFATTLASNGTSITVISALMGHANLATTGRYVHPDRSAMMDAIRDNELSRRLAI